ncbi:MAG TPA: AAA family ATPase [Actinomycetota bacterium]|nr:AAA family ATPase [Actinomycetota bacterium]
MRAGELNGRAAELALVREALGQVAEGAGGVILVEGGAGMGKSRLLAEVAAIAHGLGFRNGITAAEPSERVVELAGLLAALFEGTAPLLDRRALPGLRSQPEQRFWVLGDLQTLLERASLESPLLIGLDDAQWVDSGTAAALRTLPVRLAGIPIAWVVAFRPSREALPLVSALDQLRRRDPTEIVLGPLERDAVEALASDVLGAMPDQRLLQLLDQAGGSPFLLMEMLLGLREEERVRVVDARAELIDGRLPHRVQAGMRERLAQLSEAAGNVAMVAASLGQVFSFGDLARTLGWPPSELLAPVGELLEADLLVERSDELAFWHDITREAVRASVPASARRALDRQAADVLLQRGALPVEVAVQLSASAEPGDDVAVITLLEAAEALLTTDPTTAAQFGERALELAPAHHPRRGEIVSTTAIALHIAGNSDEAIAFADGALRQTLPVEHEAEVRLGIAGMFAISPEIRIGAGRVALSLPGLSETTRARHLACLFHNLVTAGRIEQARSTLDEARDVVESAGDVRAAFTLRLAESALTYADDRFGPSLALVTAAYRDGIFAGDDQRLRLAHMWHGELLSVLDRDEDALQVATDGHAAAQRDRQGWTYEMFETWRGRILFRTGQLSEARAALEGRFEVEDGTHAVTVLDGAGMVALGRLALHMGDTRQVRRLRDVARVMFDRAPPAVRRHAGWLLALFAMSDGDAAAAWEWVRTPVESDGRPIHPRFPMDVADEVHLARMASASGDDELMGLAIERARRRAELNPEVASMAATAAHVAGLVERRRDRLEEAVRLFEGTPRRLEHASALEDLGACLVESDRDTAVEALGRALAINVEIGASWDARRIRGRLRNLGVRRRIVSAEPETSGWTAMTGSEVMVAHLVAQGLTNREVAERLFVSPHTVNSHLRHVFTKLAINSRVELARLVAEHEAG